MHQALIDAQIFDRPPFGTELVAGSVTLDGVSLTVNDVSANTFTVNIVPHTQEMTTISGWDVGQRINLEVDVVARYLERLLSARDDARQGQ